MLSNWIPDPRSKGVQLLSSNSSASEAFNTGWDTFCAQLTTAGSTETKSISLHSRDGNYVELDSSSSAISTPSRPAKAQSNAYYLQPPRVSQHFTRPKRQGTISQPSWLKTSIGKVRKTKNQQALDNLRDIERGSPRHSWTPEERTFLCVLNRWYRRSPEDFTRIFNSIHGLNLSIRKVTSQFESCLRLFGRQAYPEYNAVFSVPFNDPEGVYKDQRSVIEYEARALGLFLRPLDCDHKSSAEGVAKKAKALRTRERYKALVRRKGLVKQYEESPGHSAQRPPTLGGYAILADPLLYEEVVDAEEQSTLALSSYFVDAEKAEELFTPTRSFSRTQPNRSLAPSLAFRVWSTSSRAQLTPNGFRSELFTNWRGAVSAPLSPSNPLWDVLAANHLSKKSRWESAFISCAASLIQVLNNKVAKGYGNNPQLCLIDLTQLNQPGKLYKAQEVISDLKRKGQMSWARYKGLSEFLIWGDIPATAIISSVPIFNLEELAGDFLCSNLFSPNTRTRTVASQIKAKGIVLGHFEAKKIGEIAQLLGLAQPAVASLSHITAFVTAIVDGWYIHSDRMPDRDVALSFAMALKSQDYAYCKVMDAFLKGVEQGTKNIVTYSGRRGESGRCPPLS